MAWSKGTEERQWKSRKQAKNPHDKVKSYKQLAEEAGKDENK
ncbi:DUF6254 family protein [Caldibacillus lycopersici]|uniref:DUF6254 family protein n=1 Tax=Perspicuibacillus lycopersici TaxID=1325689 RepID=A0AAE3IQE6_9BACI|nr:DUF6254 family protein [Perspicuibacillus lycopersici]MCU9612653.1 DUF6254 family protein [Perspicuibacillus lycopersici]